MLSAVFIVNNEGVILIEKQYREKVGRGEISAACLAIKDHTQTPPSFISNGDLTTLLLRKNDLWIVGVCEGDEFAMFGVSVLQYIGRLLESRLKLGASEFSVKSEYDVVYRVLDYAADFGYPFLNEDNTVSTVISRRVTDNTADKRIKLNLERPWRAMDVRRVTNEILVDVVETIDLSVSPQGKAEFCHISGMVTINSKLSGNPTCKLVLKPSTHYEDVAFHRCVEEFSSDMKVIPFLPPDGNFTLMKYRLTAYQTTVPLWITPKFKWTKNGVSFEIFAKPESTLSKPLKDLVIKFQLPNDINLPSLAPQSGQAIFNDTNKEVTWTIGTLKEQISLKGSASLSSELGDRFPIVTASFNTLGFLPSGFEIEKLDVDESQYKAFKGVKYVAKTGNYEFRTGLY